MVEEVSTVEISTGDAPPAKKKSSGPEIITLESSSDESSSSEDEEEETSEPPAKRVCTEAVPPTEASQTPSDWPKNAEAAGGDSTVGHQPADKLSADATNGTAQDAGEKTAAEDLADQTGETTLSSGRPKRKRKAAKL